MLKPSQPFAVAKDRFIVCDIENNPDGSVISIDTAWRDESKIIRHQLHFNWPDWIAWLIPRAKADKAWQTIYAHNGGGWDWLSLTSYLLSEEGRRKRQVITAACAASKMVTMTIQFEAKFSIHFADSLQLLRSSLDALGKKFLGEGKADTQGRLPHEMTMPEMLAYQQKDTELLLRVLEVSLQTLRDNVARIDTWSYTIGSTAMKVFKTMGLKQEISVPWNPVEKAFFRKGYTGGRVEVFQYGHFGNVSVYDINSLYPYAMLVSDVPTSDRTIPTDVIRAEDTSILHLRFRQSRTDIPAVLTAAGHGLYEGEGVYFSPEIHLLREVDPTAEIEILDGYKFVDTGKIFQEYVNTLYALRLSDPDGPLSLLCKYLLNSLYGKFGQKSEREQIIAVNDLCDIANILPDEATGESKFTWIDERAGIAKNTVESECAFEHIGIAGMITSVARTILYRGMLAAGKGLVYCDTDSVHCVGKFPSGLVGKALGQFKIEFKGEGVYCGKKLYGLRNEKGSKIRAKGVSVGGRNGCRLSFDDMVRIAEGGRFEAEFFQPTTALQTFRLQQPCKFGKRKRTLRKV